MTERVRFTIAVEPEVYEAFSDLAHAGGVSLSRCIGDWLRDTAEAAQVTTIKLNEVRKSPQYYFEQFVTHGIIPEVERLKGVQRAPARVPGAARSAAGVLAVPTAQRAARPGERGRTPPSSNTGGKSPGKTRRAA